MRREILGIALAGCLAAGVPVARAQDGGLLDGAESQAMSDTVQYALEKNPTQQAAEWVNPDTGRSGTVVPVRTYQTAEGVPCREFVTTITIGGRAEEGYGTACRQPDGSWQIVDDDREAAPPPPQRVYVRAAPPRYYAYPIGFYGPSRIVLSFSYVYRSGHVYPGRYFMGGPAFRHRHPVPVRTRVFLGPHIYRRYHWDRDRDSHHRPRWSRHERPGREEARSGHSDGRWSGPDRDDGRRDRR